jgi:hypothetical protein
MTLAQFVEEMKILFFISLGLGIFFLPRFPWKLHVYMNELMLKIYLILFTGYNLVFSYASYVKITHNGTTEEVVFVVIGLLVYIFLGIAYIGYWGMPCLMEWKHQKKVKQTVERYRKGPQGKLPRETLGPDQDWMPRLVVDGKSYYWVNYSIKRGTIDDAVPAKYLQGLMGVDEEGKVVRDAELANKLNRCFTLAIKTCMPFQHQVRVRKYRETIRAERAYNRYFAMRGELEKSTADLGPEVKQDLDRMYQALGVLRQSEILLRKCLLLEADYAYRHHNIYLQECRYEEVLDLSARIRQVMAAAQNQWETYLEGNRAGARIFRLTYTLKPRKLHPKIMEISDLLCTSDDSVKEAMESLDPEKLNDKHMAIYKPMNALERRRWQDRLEYIDQVDGIQKGIANRVQKPAERGNMEEEFTLEGSRDVGWKEDVARTEHYFETIVNKQILPLEKWGFQLTYKDFDPSFVSRTLIYDNEACRVKIEYYLERWKREDYIEVRYGRKHASNTEGTIVWQGEECHCWHRIQ